MSTYYARKPFRKVAGVVIKPLPKPNPRVIEGFKARKCVGALCKEDLFKSVLIVTDETLFSMGFHKEVCDSLQNHGISYEVFHEINSEPTSEIIEKGREAAINCQANCIIALGGGSVLDACKIMAAGVAMPHLPVDALLLKFCIVPGKTLPMISIPSTAGTGAEITIASVVTNTKKNTKGSTVIVGLDITHVILDSELTINAPFEVTANCAIDALSHCIEGCIADISSTKRDNTRSHEGIKLIFENLPIVLKDPQNIEARQAICRAAFYGGNAINMQLAGYVHAFAHSIGAKYHIPHGKAIALCLLPIVNFHKDVCPEAIASIAYYNGLVEESESMDVAVDKFIEELGHLLKVCKIQMEPGFIPVEDYHDIIIHINLDSINYSPPKTLTNEEIILLLDEINKVSD